MINQMNKTHGNPIYTQQNKLLRFSKISMEKKCHCEERSDEAICCSEKTEDCFAIAKTICFHAPFCI